MLIGESATGRAPHGRFGDLGADAVELFEGVEGPRYLALIHAPDCSDPEWTFQQVTPLFSGGHHGAAAGSWLFRVGLGVPSEHRSEFLDWYEREHLPMLLECPAWDGCRFVEAAVVTGCRFIALHQLAEPIALSSAERARSRATPWFMRFKRFDWFDEPFTRDLYRRVARGVP